MFSLDDVEFTLVLFFLCEVTSNETGSILLDGSCLPVCDRVGMPTFLPSLIPLYLYFSKSLANRHSVSRVGIC